MPGPRRLRRRWYRTRAGRCGGGRATAPVGARRRGCFAEVPPGPRHLHEVPLARSRGHIPSPPSRCAAPASPRAESGNAERTERRRQSRGGYHGPSGETDGAVSLPPAGVTPWGRTGRRRGPLGGSATHLGDQRQQNALETCARSMWRLRVKSTRGVMERELSRRPHPRSMSFGQMSHIADPDAGQRRAAVIALTGLVTRRASVRRPVSRLGR